MELRQVPIRRFAEAPSTVLNALDDDAGPDAVVLTKRGVAAAALIPVRAASRVGLEHSGLWQGPTVSRGDLKEYGPSRYVQAVADDDVTYVVTSYNRPCALLGPVHLLRPLHGDARGTTARRGGDSARLLDAEFAGLRDAESATVGDGLADESIPPPARIDVDELPREAVIDLVASRVTTAKSWRSLGDDADVAEMVVDVLRASAEMGLELRQRDVHRSDSADGIPPTAQSS